jgi:hypothetical protein
VCSCPAIAAPIVLLSTQLGDPLAIPGYLGCAQRASAAHGLNPGRVWAIMRVGVEPARGREGRAERAGANWGSGRRPGRPVARMAAAAGLAASVLLRGVEE